MLFIFIAITIISIIRISIIIIGVIVIDSMSIINVIVISTIITIILGDSGMGSFLRCRSLTLCLLRLQPARPRSADKLPSNGNIVGPQARSAVPAPLSPGHRGRLQATPMLQPSQMCAAGPSGGC